MSPGFTPINGKSGGATWQGAGTRSSSTATTATGSLAETVREGAKPERDEISSSSSPPSKQVKSQQLKQQQPQPQSQSQPHSQPQQQQQQLRE
ncbi:hypothetical protein KEM54_004032, partial [Ascosphaera aggregata]